ncbi:hypothetical protein COT12_00650 [Candidatus Berkelbacteria bacterium CG08_land_8_20_14_0_20_39_8]|uniref:LytR/CpsA/Psr regulator C-terminal domain-containing protein n=1 Tax=Candidatus Berkelbacteria bacterium CG08_land_8_20_14_0_20_39_8 TaxID=1974511 RepID=A0A2M6YCV0_9BACT|nr:MAG: hypothetical protein COT12_00650 [Candidatus Berkelbacteria bacterium CG08_land_8_20_14_0_20_39_8]
MLTQGGILGISDDIRPKKFRPISKKTEKRIIKSAQKQLKQRDDGQLFQQADDGDFFADTPIKNSNQPKFNNDHNFEHRHSYRWIHTTIIVLVICVLIGLIVWQNYSTIKGYIDGSYKNQNDQKLSDIIDSTSKSSENYNNGKQTATQSSTAEQQPTTPEIDRSALTISVLNGSGVKNSAATIADTLKSAGFQIKTISNARSFNYAKTYIYYKTDDSTVADLIKASLSGRDCEAVKNASIVGSAYDIVVVVGKT